MSEEKRTFEQKLKDIINQHCKENDSNTPDFILAQYMNNCLEAYTLAVKARDKWYQFDPWAKILTGIKEEA